MNRNELANVPHGRREAERKASRLDHVIAGWRNAFQPSLYEGRCTACNMDVMVWYDDENTLQMSGQALVNHCAPQPRPAARPMTVDDLDGLYPGKEVYMLYEYNKRNIPLRLRLASQVQRWKREPSRFRFSLRYGIERHTYVINTPEQLAHLTLDTPGDFKFPHEL